MPASPIAQAPIAYAPIACAPIAHIRSIALGAALMVAAAGPATTAVTAAAETTQTLTQTASVAIEDQLRAPLLRPYYGTPRTERHLGVAERIGIEPFDPALGELVAVRIEIDAAVAKRFSATIGDASPLNEAPEPVMGAGGMTSRFDVIGPTGAYLASETIAAPTAGCSGPGTCVFGQDAEHPVALMLEPKPAGFVGTEPLGLTLRSTATGGLLTQICEPGEWDRCRVKSARLAVETPPEGVRVHYEFRPAAAAAAGAAALPPVASSGPTFWTAVSSVIGALGLAIIGMLLARNWARQVSDPATRSPAARSRAPGSRGAQRSDRRRHSGPHLGWTGRLAQ